MTERILITGGAGFIGFHIAKRLACAGYELCLADNLSRGVQDVDLNNFAMQRAAFSM